MVYRLTLPVDLEERAILNGLAATDAHADGPRLDYAIMAALENDASHHDRMRRWAGDIDADALDLEAITAVLSGELREASIGVVSGQLHDATPGTRARLLDSLERLNEGQGPSWSPPTTTGNAAVLFTPQLGSKSLKGMRADESDPWPQLRPLSTHRLPSCPLDALPKGFAGFAGEVARATETDPQMGFILVLGVAAGVVSRGNVARASHSEPMNVWCIASTTSGERKSEIVRTARKPVDAVAHYLATEPATQAWRNQCQAEWDAASARVHRATEALKKPDGKTPFDRGAQTVELAEAKTELEQLGTRPQKPVILTQDITPERLGQLLEGNGTAGIGEIAILADAESSLDAITGSRTESSAALVLKCHAADSHSDDRVGRNGVNVISPRLTMALATQPTVIRALLADRELCDKGFPARMLIVSPEPRAHTKHGDTPAVVDQRLTEPLTNRIFELGKAFAEYQQTESHPHNTPTLCFADDAGPLIREFELRLSRRMAPGEDLAEGNIRSWASKAHGAAQRLSGVLHCYTDQSQTPWLEPISVQTTANAVRLVEEWLLPHAKAVMAAGDPLAEATEAIERHLKRCKEPDTNEGAIWDSLRRTSPFGSRVTPSEDRALFTEALTVLTERGICRRVLNPSSQTGRPKADTIQIRQNQPDKPDKQTETLDKGPLSGLSGSFSGTGIQKVVESEDLPGNEYAEFFGDEPVCKECEKNRNACRAHVLVDADASYDDGDES